LIRRRVRAAAIALVLIIASVFAPAAAVAVDGDTTPPTPGGAKPVEFYDYSHVTQLIDVKVSFADTESAITLLVSCEGGPVAAYPYAEHIFVPALDADAGGCPAYGAHLLEIRASSDGGETAAYQTEVRTSPSFRLQYPVAAETGKPFTVHPTFSGGWTPPADAVCLWEVRWGSVPALRDNNFDETFGGMMSQGTASQGFCGDWTFTLPWVPVPRFEFNLDVPGANNVRTSMWPDRDLVYAAVVGTDRRIRASSLPMVQVLPDRYSPIAGQPVTYTRYLIGGATATSADGPRWTAFLGDSENPPHWERLTTSATFTITPPAPGNLFVGWDRAFSPMLMGAYYDPPVRYRDTTRPNTTLPVQRLNGAASPTGAPTTIAWTGSDRGWGIDHYTLQRSVDAGAWRGVALAGPRLTSAAQLLPFGHTYRYRVRAVDKAGNVGYWDYGPTFRPGTYQETSASIVYRGTWTRLLDADALGGAVRQAVARGASATFTFRARDLAWVASTGPDHGKANVYVDGLFVGTIDLSAVTPSDRRLVFRRHWSFVGSHIIRIVTLGTAGRPKVDVDAFLVLR
jgi:hypothetical protein